MATDASSTDELVFFVNGKKVREEHADPAESLLHYLRKKLYLTGSKYGCGEGGCGACTVMLSHYNNTTKRIHYVVNACLTPVCAVHGLAVTTVEGLGSTKKGLHPIQERLVKTHGIQCGFCTPGMIMSMYALLRNQPLPSMAQIESAFDGNLCRCTGYRPILDGVKTFSKEFCQMGENCCKNKRLEAAANDNVYDNDVSPSSEFTPYDPTQEPIFPPELQLKHVQFHGRPMIFKSSQVTWYRPVELSHLLDLKQKHPDARLVVGNTEVGVEMNCKNMHYPILIGAGHVTELLSVEHLDTGIKIGGSVTLSRLDEILKQEIETLPEWKTRVYSALVEMLQWFGGHQIRNTAAVGGNITTASPISDLNPLFLAAGAQLEVASKDGGWRKITMDDKFFKGYRKTEIKPEEVLISVTVPHTRKNEYFAGYKQANRREDDIAIVNAGMRVVFEPETNIIRGIWLAFGGMAPITVMASKTMEYLVGKTWNENLLPSVISYLTSDLPLPAGSPGGMVEYRSTLTISFFFKFYIMVHNQLQKLGLSSCEIPTAYHSAVTEFDRLPRQSCQVFDHVASGQPSIDPVGRPLVHRAAYQQATGEAQYVSDIPPYADELFLSLVTSTHTHAKIVDIDATAALSLPGVVDFLCYKDVPGQNRLQLEQEEIFASTEVTCQGQVIGAIIANSKHSARHGSAAVKIVYEDLEPAITIEDAIEQNLYYPPIHTIRHGDIETGFAMSDHVIEGEVRTGAQEHFYIEPHVAVAVPREAGEMEVFAATQNPCAVQGVISEALRIPANKIAVRTKRLGGGFGGKETRTVLVAAPVAIAAAKHNRPVRCALDRDEDIKSTGTRHPFLGKYKVGFMSDGRLMALEVDLYSNCGISLDVSEAVMDRALLHTDNSYFIPHIRATGHLCKTNIPSCTAFRGFGAPQSMFIAETWITDVAGFLHLPPETVREKNLFKEGDVTPFNLPLTKCNIRRCWDECIKQSQYGKRRKEVDLYNSENRWKKKGLAVTPVTFGIGFGVWELNQTGALVHVYTDGSVLIAHGGIEMGQGLHTKMIQVASRVLKIPTSKIHISETSTVTVPNNSPSAASTCSDLNGMAIVNACTTILERLDPIITANPKGCWEDWIKAAYIERISLSATGFYRTPDLWFDWEKSVGNPFGYYTFGVACSEVDIDCLTGDHQILRTNIVMDVGSSLNPAIDIGQIEGGFIQGYGMMVLEQYKVSPKGHVITQGPGNYKIPTMGNIPAQFNVSLLKGSLNQRAVYSSKAIGEPPLFLASSVFFAIRDAIKSARVDAGKNAMFRMDCPATAARIRMACQDDFTKHFPEAPLDSYIPWFVQL